MSTHHKVIGLDAEQVPKVTKRDRCVDLKPKFTVVVGRCDTGPLRREADGLDLPEVHHQQISLRLRGQTADRVLDAQLDGAHDLGRLDLLVGDLTALAHSSVADLPLLLMLGLLPAHRSIGSSGCGCHGRQGSRGGSYAQGRGCPTFATFTVAAESSLGGVHCLSERPVDFVVLCG